MLEGRLKKTFECFIGEVLNSICLTCNTANKRHRGVCRTRRVQGVFISGRQMCRQRQLVLIHVNIFEIAFKLWRLFSSQGHQVWCTAAVSWEAGKRLNLIVFIRYPTFVFAISWFTCGRAGVFHKILHPLDAAYKTTWLSMTGWTRHIKCTSMVLKL